MITPQSEADTIFEEIEAVEMFITYARRARPDFDLSEEDKPAVVRICQLVGGMPLAIELAASWARMLPPDEIAAELEADLDFLATEREDLPERQRSMRAAFEYSWNLLNDAERDALMKLSVFRGGASRAAARHVSGASLPVLVALADKSLLKRDPDSGTFDVHELLRQFAEERLAESGQDAATRDLHAAYYADALAKREGMLKGGGQVGAIEDISGDFENVRAMWSWATSQGRYDFLSRSLTSLLIAIELTARHPEGDEMFEAAVTTLRGQADAPAALLSRLLSGWTWMIERRYSDSGYERALETAQEALPPGQQASDRLAEAWAFYMQAYLLWRLERLREAEPLAEQARATFEELGLRWEMALTRHLLGLINGGSGRPEDGIALLKAALEARRALGDHWGMGHTLNVLAIGHQHNLDDFQAALGYYERSLEAFQKIGDRQGMWYPINNGAYILAWLGDYDAARQKFVEAQALAKEIGNDNLAGATRLGLTWTELWAGDLDEAQRRAEHDLAILLPLDLEDPLADVRQVLAIIAVERGEWQQAREYAEAALAYRRRTGGAGTWMPIWILGRAALAIGERDIARQYLREALEVTSAYHINPAATGVLYAIALWLAGAGEVERAVELTSLSASHPASLDYTRRNAHLILNDLKSQLAADKYESAIERGKTLDLQATAAHLLEELS